MQCCSAISDACADYSINYEDDCSGGLDRDTAFLNQDSQDDHADLFRLIDLKEHLAPTPDEDLRLCRRVVITRRDK